MLKLGKQKLKDKAEIGKAESRNPKARARHSAVSYFCFLLSQFQLFPTISAFCFPNFSFSPTPNIQHPTSNTETPLFQFHLGEPEGDGR